nr:MAG TPA: hypothetical protein [Inoviridae sp.]
MPPPWANRGGARKKPLSTKTGEQFRFIRITF